MPSPWIFAVAAGFLRASSGTHLRAAREGNLVSGFMGGGGGGGADMPVQDAGAVAHVNTLGSHPYPLPRSNMPDGFGSKVEFQTVSEQAGGRTVFHERLVRCGIEKDENGNEKFPCNPAFDLRPFVKGLDRVGSGFNILTGEKTTPLFEWSVPPWQVFVCLNSNRNPFSCHTKHVSNPQTVQHTLGSNPVTIPAGTITTTRFRSRLCSPPCRAVRPAW